MSSYDQSEDSYLLDFRSSWRSLCRLWSHDSGWRRCLFHRWGKLLGRWQGDVIDKSWPWCGWTMVNDREPIPLAVRITQPDLPAFYAFLAFRLCHPLWTQWDLSSFLCSFLRDWLEDQRLKRRPLKCRSPACSDPVGWRSRTCGDRAITAKSLPNNTGVSQNWVPPQNCLFVVVHGKYLIWSFPILRNNHMWSIGYTKLYPWF